MKADCTPGDVRSPVHSWLPGVSSMFTIRGKNYMEDKKKCISAEGLYQAAGVDYWHTDARVSNICDILDLDSVLEDAPVSSIAGVPSLIVFNTQIPSAAPSLTSTRYMRYIHTIRFFYSHMNCSRMMLMITTLSSSSEDGQSYEAILYFTLSNETKKALENLETAPESVKLWAK